MTTFTLPAPEAQVSRPNYRGEKTRSRNVHFPLDGTERTTADGTERLVVQVHVGHSTSSKTFFATANQVTIGTRRLHERDGAPPGATFTTEAYFPFDGVTLARRPVARYSDKALDTFLAEVLAVFPDLVAGSAKLQAMFTDTDGKRP